MDNQRGDLLERARAGDPQAFASLVEPHRRELRLYAWRMTGSTLEADDVVQDTLERAWKAIPSFEGRCSTRGWLYGITNHLCIDRGRRRRHLPLDLGRPLSVGAAPGDPQPGAFLEPFPDGLLPDPEQSASARETLTLTFQWLLQRMPPKQRAAYILRELVEVSAEEAAEWLGVSAASVHSAVARARATLASEVGRPEPEPADLGLATRYARAFEAGDISLLVELVHEDLALAMPPYPGWYVGRDNVLAFLGDHLFVGGPRRCTLTRANGQDAVALYRTGPDGELAPSAILLLAADGGRIRRIEAFLMPQLFPLFGL